MAEVEVEAPHDVEALVVQFYLRNGVAAQSELGAQRDPGMVRVTRSGGDLQNHGVQDAPQVLVEVWDETAVASWDLTMRAWALLAAAGREGQIGGVQLDDIDLDVPRTLDDELAPGLHRHQFLAVLTVETTTMTIDLEGDHP